MLTIGKLSETQYIGLCDKMAVAGNPEISAQQRKPAEVGLAPRHLGKGFLGLYALAAHL
jgi:hypothetical protein